MTALTTYGTTVASGTLATAGTLATGTGGTSANKTSLVGTATLYGELYALGNAGAWGASGSIGAPSDNGWLLDATTLEGQTLAAGTYTPSVHIATNANTCTADVIFRAYKRSVGGIYTAIGSWTIANMGISVTATTYSPTASSVPAMAFVTGDKLYVDVWLNITASTMVAGNTIKVSESSTSSGIATDTQLTTPGFAATPPAGGLGMSLLGVG